MFEIAFFLRSFAVTGMYCLQRLFRVRELNCIKVFLGHEIAIVFKEAVIRKMEFFALRDLVSTTDTHDRTETERRSNPIHGGHQQLGRLNIMTNPGCLPDLLEIVHSLNAGYEDHMIV